VTYLYVFIAVLSAIIVAGYLKSWPWTGLVVATDAKPARETKTLWDWLALLIVPLVLAAGAYGINSAQSSRDQQREANREKQQDEIAADGRSAEALRAYLQQMSGLIVDHNLASTEKRAADNSEDAFDRTPIAALARSLTLTVLRQLDGPRRGRVAQFLAEAGLIKYAGTAVIDLEGADLRGAELAATNLTDTTFTGTDLRGANLRGATIGGAGFALADLRAADFSNTSYGDAGGRPAIFNFTCLTRAQFTGSQLPRASFVDAQGRDLDFSAATIERGEFEGASLMTVSDTPPNTFPKAWGPRGVSTQTYDARTNGPCNLLESQSP